MPKQIYLTPTKTDVSNASPFMDVISSDTYGSIDLISTGSTVNNISAQKNVYLEDVHIPSSHQKVIESDLNVLGNIYIDKGVDVTVGSEQINTDAYIYVNGFVNVTDTIDLGGTMNIVGISNLSGSTGT